MAQLYTFFIAPTSNMSALGGATQMGVTVRLALLHLCLSSPQKILYERNQTAENRQPKIIK